MMGFGLLFDHPGPLPQPTGLQFTHLTMERVNFTWNPVTVNCSTLGYHYSISLTNCGNCPSRMNTTNNVVTCEELILGQTCNISLWAVTECAVSDSVSLQGNVTRFFFIILLACIWNFKNQTEVYNY